MRAVVGCLVLRIARRLWWGWRLACPRCVSPTRFGLAPRWCAVRSPTTGALSARTRPRTPGERQVASCRHKKRLLARDLVLRCRMVADLSQGTRPCQVSAPPERGDWAAHRCCTDFSLVEEVLQSHYRAHLYQKSEEAQILLRALI